MRRIAVAMLGLTLLGCSQGVTETGYEPRKLGMGNAQRRGLYAPRYSPEEAQATAEREQQEKSHRPITAPGGGPGSGPGY